VIVNKFGFIQLRSLIREQGISILKSLRPSSCKLEFAIIYLTLINMDPKMQTPTEKTVGISTSISVEYVETQGFDERATKKMIRRIDWHLIPFLALIYL